MGKKKDYAFHVKLKIIPPPPYKHQFCTGVAMASTQKEAEEAALNVTKMQKWTAKHDGKEIPITIQVFKVTKLKTDFFTVPQHWEDEKSKQKD